MNQPTATGRAIRRLLLFCLCTGIMSASFAQGREMELLFDANGKLLSGYTPRFNPRIRTDKCFECDNLLVRILVPTDFYKEDWEKQSKRFNEISDIVNGKQEMLKSLLACSTCKENHFDKLKSSLNGASSFAGINNTDSIFPSFLKDYAAFLSNIAVKVPALLSEKGDKKKMEGIGKEIEATLASMNESHESRKYIPFRLLVHGLEVQDSCASWKLLDKSEVDCDCIKEGKSYISIQFRVPARLISGSTTPDSFQVVRKYPEKEHTIKWYNEMLEAFKDDLPLLTLVDARIRAAADDIAIFVATIDSLRSFKSTCTDKNFLGIVEDTLCNRLASQRELLRTKLGDFLCKDQCTSLLTCYASLRKWIVKCLWLNGSELRLNPFSFTTDMAFSGKKSRAEAKMEALKVAQDEARIRQKFWETAISHLQDSIMRRDVDLKKATADLDTLLARKRAADEILAKEMPGLPVKAIEANLADRKLFFTTSKVFYKGWIVPYRERVSANAYKPDRRWVRSYYLDDMPAPLRQKLHYYYPENENVTVLLHNVSAGTGTIIKESIKPFADSAAFTVGAGKFVSELASLYGSLSSIAPQMAGLLKFAGGVIGSPSKIKGGGATAPVASVVDATTSVPESADLAGQPVNLYFLTNKQIGNATKIEQPEKVSEELSKFINKPYFVLLQRSNYTPVSYGINSIENAAALKDSLAARQKIKKKKNYFFRAAVLNKKVVISPTTTASELRKYLYDTLHNNSDIKYILVADTIGKKATTFEVKDKSLEGIRTLVLTLLDSLKPRIPEIAAEPEQRGTCKNITDSADCLRSYFTALLSIASAPAFFNEKMKPLEDTVPLFRTDRFPLSDSIAPYENKYEVSTYTRENGKDVPGVKIATSHINVGKFRYWQTAAGIAYTPNAGFINSVDTSGGGLVITRDEDRFRLIGGFRVYPFGLYNQRNPVGLFRELRWIHRLSILGAIGVPKPFQNLYLGAGFDIVPGLNLTVGAHFQQQNNYEIVANQVKSRTVSYKPLTFYSVTIDPGLLVNVVKSLFK